MSALALAAGLRLRQFEADAGAVAFNPVTADTHLIGDAAYQVLEWWRQASQPLDRQQALDGLLAEATQNKAMAADKLALSDLFSDLLKSGLLVELPP